MQLDLGGHPAQAGSKRPAMAGYASLVGNRVGQKGNPRRLAELSLHWRCPSLTCVPRGTSTDDDMHDPAPVLP
jgi:hypothetical protein